MSVTNHFFGAFIAIWLTYILLEKPLLQEFTPESSQVLNPNKAQALIEGKKETVTSFPFKYAIVLLFLCGITVVLLTQSFKNVLQNWEKRGLWYRIKKYSIPLIFSVLAALLINFFETAFDFFKPFGPTPPLALLFIIFIVLSWVLAFEKIICWDKVWRDEA